MLQQGCYNKELLGNVTLNIAGQHNVLTHLAATAMCLEFDIPFPRLQQHLKVLKALSVVLNSKEHLKVQIFLMIMVIIRRRLKTH